MTRLFESTAPIVPFVVQAKSEAGRESYPASTEAAALEKARALSAEGREVQVLAAERGVVALDDLAAQRDASEL